MNLYCGCRRDGGGFVVFPPGVHDGEVIMHARDVEEGKGGGKFTAGIHGPSPTLMMMRMMTMMMIVFKLMCNLSPCHNYN